MSAVILSPRFSNEGEDCTTSDAVIAYETNRITREMKFNDFIEELGEVEQLMPALANKAVSDEVLGRLMRAVQSALVTRIVNRTLDISRPDVFGDDVARQILLEASLVHADGYWDKWDREPIDHRADRADLDLARGEEQ